MRLFFTGELGVPGTVAMSVYVNAPQSLLLWQLYLVVVLAPVGLALLVLVTTNALLVTGSTAVQVALAGDCSSSCVRGAGRT